MIRLRRAFWLHRRKKRVPNDLMEWLWQSGGIVLLGALAAGMTAFPAETLTVLKPVGNGLRFVVGAGLKGFSEIRSVGRLGAKTLHGVTSMARDMESMQRDLQAVTQQEIINEEQLRELIRLRSQLSLKQNLGYETWGARVIGQDPGSSFTSLMLDAGSQQGVRKGQAVLAPGGAVGRIISIGPDFSVLLWLCDPRSRIAAYVQRSRVHGVLAGNGTGCELKYLSFGDDIKVGDRVLTAGRGSVFPKGILIGIVKEVRREGLLLAADVAPTVRIESLEEVLIVFRRLANQ
jgi:rod shape-determining protein MreC